MAKAAKQETAAKPKSKKEQYERFRKTARDLGIENEQGVEAFEKAFKKLMPPKRHDSR
jgi:hypothetical protein